MIRPMDSVKMIAFDADDTLWVNEPLYRGTEERLHALLAPYGDPEAIEKQLYSVEMRNLRLFGYGAKGFMLSMIETAIELTRGRITGAEIQQIIDLGRALLLSPIELLEGVEEALQTLAGEAAPRLMLLTKGDLLDQESKLVRSGLGDYFHHVEIVSDKNENTYRRTLERYGLEPHEFVMIGNSLRSDILPVLAIGARAIYIPYHTTWAHETVREEELEGRGVVQVESMREALEWLRGKIVTG
jgi:putative hydrolase of the HAD superfamily